MSKQIRVLNGLHHGAEVPFAPQDRHVIGSDAQCSIVLCDRGIAARHCAVSTDDYGMTCRAIEGVVVLDGRELEPGEAASLEDFQVIQCGAAALSVGPVEGDWTAAERAIEVRRVAPFEALRSLQRLNPYALFATVLLGITCVIGLAYAALSDRSVELTPTRVEAARQWLKTVAPAGSELTIGMELAPAQGLLLSGYVQFSHQLPALANASKSSAFEPRIDVYAIDDMTSSMARLAQLADIPCEPQYKGAGHFACTSSVSSDAVATKLRMLARDVPGLRSLDVPVVPPAVASAPPPPPPAVPTVPARLTRKFSVLMFRKQRYLIGPYGEKYTEGEEFDGFKINRIGVDKVTFERDGREFEFYVAALGAPQ